MTICPERLRLLIDAVGFGAVNLIDVAFELMQQGEGLSVTTAIFLGVNLGHLFCFKLKS